MRVVGATCQILPTLLLLTLTGRLCDAEELTRITGIQGGSVFLLPLVPSGFNPREVFWRHLSPIDHLVASFSRGSLDTTYQSCFHGRVKLLQNFTLEILGLDLRDTGMFTCQMVDTQGHMQLHRFYLSVYEVAAKPEVQVFVSRQGQDCALFLSCNVTTGNNVTYSWIVDTGQEGQLNETYRLYDEKRLLKMTLNSTHQDVSFTCVVTNPVSQENTSVIPWTSCVTEPGQDFKTNNGKIVILVAAALIIMFTTAMICVYFFSRTSGKTPVKGRQRTNIHTGETFLQLEEENDSPELTGLQDNEETTAQQNGEMTLGHNTDQDSIEERTVQFSPETIVTHKVETIV